MGSPGSPRNESPNLLPRRTKQQKSKPLKSGPLQSKPLVVASLAQQIADQIREVIMDGTLKAGERLPTDDDLAKQFGVSSPTIREALKRLSARNLIRSGEPMGLLVLLHRENGTMDALVERVEAAVERDPHLTQLVDFRRLLLAAEERWELLFGELLPQYVDTIQQEE